jgi:uncharacterized UPF0160 family protein
MSEFKRVKVDDEMSQGKVSDKVIGTHSGTFQADEAMGCFLLRQLNEYKFSKIVRSRDTKILTTCDIVIDVGGTYDHSKKLYDHHQRGYDERFQEKRQKPRCTKLSASGLVYRHYGKDVIKVYYPNLSDDHLEFVYVKLYNSLLEALDAIDTGVEMIPTNTNAGDDTIELVYKDTTGLSNRVSRLNPRWNEYIDERTGIAPDCDARFLLASEMCGQDFLAVLTKIVESDLPARKIVEQAVLDRYTIDPSGEIISFPSGGLPWKSYLYEFEKIHAATMNKLIKFVLYTDQDGMWRVQAVTVEGKAFENRVSLPEHWRGVRDEELETVTNIKGSRFVHAAGFIGGNTYYEGALQMAKVALGHAIE